LACFFIGTAKGYLETVIRRHKSTSLITNITSAIPAAVFRTLIFVRKEKEICREQLYSGPHIHPGHGTDTS
jgi:hypothetical protein